MISKIEAHLKTLQEALETQKGIARKSLSEIDKIEGAMVGYQDCLNLIKEAGKSTEETIAAEPISASNDEVLVGEVV